MPCYNCVTFGKARGVRSPHPTKKERKAKYREYRYQKSYQKWLSSEPPEWRFISHARWLKKRPEYPH